MEGCIFCKINSGEIPAKKVYEDENFTAILDIAPNALGHLLVFPKKHQADIFSLDDETAAKLMPVVKRLSVALQKTLGFDGMNLLQNNGVLAGQTVMHFHIHLIPRYENDAMTVEWKKAAPGQEETERFVARLESHLSFSHLTE